jgi:O-antigen/teichoic acid export membrane protein
MLKTLTHGFGRLKISGENSPVWRRFRRNVSISVFGSGLSLAIKLLQIALLTKFLRIEDYGRVLIVTNLFLFLDAFFGLRVSDAMFRFYQPLQEQGDDRSVKRLLLICLGISLASGLVICGVVWTLSPVLADRFYPGLELGPLFNIYAGTILVSTFSGFYEPILRMHDRFTSIVIPQVLGGLCTLTIFALYFTTRNGYDVKLVITAFAVGVLVQSIPPLVHAVRIVKPLLLKRNTNASPQSSTRLRTDLARCLFNSNLSGYLRIGITPGDVFLLGLFSSPAQVALYGLAKQLTAPLSLLTTNTQTAISPEITALIAKEKFEQLQCFVVQYFRSALIVSVCLLLVAILLGRILLERFRPEYAAALAAFNILLTVVAITLIFVAFRPLAVSLDLLKWHNLGLLLSSSFVIVFVFVGELNAVRMALIQLGDTLLVRVPVNLLVWKRLSGRAKNFEPEVVVTPDY